MAPRASAPSSAPLFDQYHIVEVQYLCSRFLLKVASLDSRVSVPHAKVLQGFGASGLELVQKCSRTIFVALNDKEAAAAALKDERWLFLYGNAVLSTSRYQIESLRSFKEARAALSSLLSLLRSDQLADSDGALRSLIPQLWFEGKALLLQVAERQARFKDAIAIATLAAREASTLFHGFWMRLFIFSRGRMNMKLGNLELTIADCDACIQQFTNNHLEDALLVRCLSLKAAALRTAYLLESAASGVKETFAECLQLLRKARDIAQFLCTLSGAFPADSNGTFRCVESAVHSHHAISPIHYCFTELHNNEPNLTLHPSFDLKRLRIACDINLTGEQVGSNELFAAEEVAGNNGSIENVLKRLRFGPIDSDVNIYSPSCFANIYLASMRALVLCHANVCLIVNDARRSGALPANSAVDLLNEEVLVGESGIKVFLLLS